MITLDTRQAARTRPSAALKLTVGVNRAGILVLRYRGAHAIAELVGAIGGAEGIGAIIDDAWARYLRPDAAIVPHRVRTPIAALAVSELLGGAPRLHADAVSYVKARAGALTRSERVAMAVCPLARE